MAGEENNNYDVGPHSLTTSLGVGNPEGYGDVHVAEIRGGDWTPRGRDDQDFRHELGEAVVAARNLGRLVTLTSVNHDNQRPSSSVVVVSEAPGVFENVAANATMDPVGSD